MGKRCLPLLAALLLSGQDSPASAQSVSASYQDGLVSINCRNAPLASVFEKLEEVAGVELILEDAVKDIRLTANLEGVPLAMAVQRLLEGNGVNYAVMMDPRDWGRVDKVFVGAGGGGPARSAPPPRRAPEDRVDDGYDDLNDLTEAEDMLDGDFDDMSDDFADDSSDENGPSELAPPGSSPVPGYLPPQQAFPRSNFTPGLPGPVAPGASQPPPNQTAPPPATMPFMDALGRPIPVPPDVNQQEQRRRQQQQQ